MAEVLKPGVTALRKCIKALSAGKAIVYPTETVYGLGADATNKLAVKRLFEIKTRDPSKPMSIALADVSAAEKFAIFNDTARMLAKKFLPGPLTLVLKARRSLPLITLKGTVGIRIPNHSFALSLLRRFKKPITATSANVSGLRSAVLASDVHSRLWTNVEIVVDDSETKYRLESTVLDVTSDKPKILREGAIKKGAIENVLNTKIE